MMPIVKPNTNKYFSYVYNKYVCVIPICRGTGVIVLFIYEA